METAFWESVGTLAPEVSQNDVRVARDASGTLELSGYIKIEYATRFNISVHRFLQKKRAEFNLNGKTSTKGLEICTPRVRLGEVTSEEDRRILASHTNNPLYLDPKSLVHAPEWNTDFLVASDRRNEDHITPRYLRDDVNTIDAAASFIADYLKEGSGVVVHTGAGLSAAAGIATYRDGPRDSISMSAALPTYAHFALVALNKQGRINHVCSQNVDGLHRRSGLDADHLSELHGNSYIETCSCCRPPLEFVRPYNVTTTCREWPPKFWAQYKPTPDGGKLIEANTFLTRNEQISGIHHITGGACPRNAGPLRDSIVHFGESLPIQATEKAERRSGRAPMNLVIGSSLLVKPASSLPFAAKSGTVAIISITCTGGDVRALRRGGVLLHAPADVAIERIMRHLDIDFPNSPKIMQVLQERVQDRDKDVLKGNSMGVYDGGADGGVVPRYMFAKKEPEKDPTAQRHVLLLRQTHALAEDEGWHKWSLRLEEETEGSLGFVTSVRFKLHPTFKPPVYVLSEPPFSIGPFCGWGSFDVVVEVERQGLPVLQTLFPLDFGQPERTLVLDA